MHPVQFGKTKNAEGVQVEDSILSYVTCKGNSYIVGIKGRKIPFEKTVEQPEADEVIKRLAQLFPDDTMDTSDFKDRSEEIFDLVLAARRINEK